MVIDVQVKKYLKKKTGLTLRGMATNILVENDFKKNFKNPVCETVVWPLADRVKNLIGKKWPGLSDSGVASGGLISYNIARF